MTEVASAAARPPEMPDAYIARLLAVLGSRDPVAVLRATPAELRRAIEGLDAATLAQPEAPGLWSIAAVVQHLAHSDLVVGVRLRMMLAHDRPPLAAYDQQAWARELQYDRADAHLALAEFEQLRAGMLRLIESLTPRQRARVGIHSERGPESVEQTIVNQAGHDLVHLNQIARIRRAIGA
jgi:hypothetical protein